MIQICPELDNLQGRKYALFLPSQAGSSTSFVSLLSLYAIAKVIMIQKVQSKTTIQGSFGLINSFILSSQIIIVVDARFIN